MLGLWDNADLAKDGCEINVKTDNLNCNACGRKCPTGTTCSNGYCLRGSFSMATDGISSGGNPPCLSCVDACAIKFGSPPAGWKWAGSTSSAAIYHQCAAATHYVGAWFSEVKALLPRGTSQASVSYISCSAASFGSSFQLA